MASKKHDEWVEYELELFSRFFKRFAGEPMCEADQLAIKGYLNWKGHTRADDGPPCKGDWILFRGQHYTVKRVWKWTIDLLGELNDMKIRCLKPIAQGGFSEATVIRRAPR